MQNMLLIVDISIKNVIFVGWHYGLMESIRYNSSSRLGAVAHFAFRACRNALYTSADARNKVPSKKERLLPTFDNNVSFASGGRGCSNAFLFYFIFKVMVVVTKPTDHVFVVDVFKLSKQYEQV
uniref:(northern house mosquito) hypothetical protein n=1 Tax=Culex pipiens TaxID=7175 RepID=A0A8D8BX24_CULPI